jgi:hypothetical protein
MTLYHCPECDRIHDEPFEAAAGMFAICFDCGSQREWFAARAVTIELPRAA